MPQIDELDHLVLTVADIDRAVSFYVRILGMEMEVFRAADGTDRTALRFGAQKINLHASSRPYAPHAAHPTPGSADLCFLSSTDLSDWQAHLNANDVQIVDGPIARTGATGPILSLYFFDPDGNLIEISTRA